jgi:hypothetical protein
MINDSAVVKAEKPTRNSLPSSTKPTTKTNSEPKSTKGDKITKSRVKNTAAVAKQTTEKQVLKDKPLTKRRDKPDVADDKPTPDKTEKAIPTTKTPNEPISHDNSNFRLQNKQEETVHQLKSK